MHREALARRCRLDIEGAGSWHVRGAAHTGGTAGYRLPDRPARSPLSGTAGYRLPDRPARSPLVRVWPLHPPLSLSLPLWVRSTPLSRQRQLLGLQRHALLPLRCRSPNLLRGEPESGRRRGRRDGRTDGNNAPPRLKTPELLLFVAWVDRADLHSVR